MFVERGLYYSYSAPGELRTVPQRAAFCHISWSVISGMDTLNRVKGILRDTLSLGDRAQRLTAESALMGSVPEFDSMAVVSVITAIEDELGITIDDDELSADVFETVGSLVRFVERKTSG